MRLCLPPPLPRALRPTSSPKQHGQRHNAAAYTGFSFLACAHLLVFEMAAPFHIGGGDANDPQLLQQQVVLLNQRLRILEGECKELDKARTAEKAQRERSSAVGRSVCMW